MAFGCAGAAPGGQRGTGGGASDDLALGGNGRTGGGGHDLGDDLGAVDAALDGGAPGDMAKPAPGCYAPRSDEICPPTIFVAPTGDDNNDGMSPPKALRHIGVGVIKAVACPFQACVVLVAGGDYQEQVALHEGVKLYGGYSADFLLRDPALHASHIVSTQDRTVIGDGLFLPARLDGFTVEGPTLTSADGRSSHAVWLRGSHQSLTIANTVILAGRGADGVPGAAGPALSCGTVAAGGGVADDCSSSSGSTGSAGGDVASGGDPGAGGSSYCASACPLIGHDGISDGQDGKPGADGGPGAGGTPASDAIGSFVAGVWQGASGGSGTRGLNATGGGGGGAGGTKRFRACDSCPSLIGGRGGDGGRGGCGGGGGLPGGPGGGAFGVTLIDSDVTLDAVTIAGGVGGTGGIGGAGNDGELPGASDNGRGDASTQLCTIFNITYWSGAGGHGGAGGRGGAGGGGAGGVGGVSAALAKVGGSTVNRVGGIMITAGAGGPGGAGGSSRGKAGIPGPAGGAVDERAF